MTLPDLAARVRAAFVDVFGAVATTTVASPGRVNLIGEHTDYNDGFVLPVAIDRFTVAASRVRSDRRVRLWSASFADAGVVELDLDAIGGPLQGRAPLDYLRGVVGELAAACSSSAATFGVRSADVCGVDVAVASNLPIGAGLSSSASFELAVLRTLLAHAGGTFDGAAAALLCQRVENRWIGLQSGVMDQMVCARATAGYALLLDCRSLAVEHVALPDDVAVVVLDTGKHRELAGSAYNERRAQCASAARKLGVASLRDVDEAAVRAARGILDDVEFRRARHVTGELRRTLAMAEALRGGDRASIARLLREGHASLRDDYEVSCRELDLMVDVANAHPGIVGARMTGGGFGGCAVALVERAAVDAFCHDVDRGYRAQTTCIPAFHVCRSTRGVHVVDEGRDGSDGAAGAR